MPKIEHFIGEVRIRVKLSGGITHADAARILQERANFMIDGQTISYIDGIDITHISVDRVR